jgi:N,N'-diacetyllegionaminate synthase
MTLQIIAELAQGFEGRPDQARLLLRAAAAAGADAAKFQLVYADELATPDYKHYALFRSLEMSDEAWQTLSADARERGIQLHLDIFGERSLELASAVGAAALKVHPTDITNVGLLRRIADSPIGTVLLGAGGAGWSEIEPALDVLSGKKVVLLVGFQGYPTPVEANQIARIHVLAELLQSINRAATIGFADHAEPGTAMSMMLAAVALGAGARVFEKHMTLGEAMKMEDHEAALNPDRFAEFVRGMRDCVIAYGEATLDDDFGMTVSEHEYRCAIRRHVVTARPVRAGEQLKDRDIVLKRSSEPQPLTDIVRVYGRKVALDIAGNQPLTAAHLKSEETL